MRLINDKIKARAQLKKIVFKLKRQGRIIAFTNGCFDILHSGHVKYLEKTKALADILIVAVNSDNSVKRIKGKKRPVVNLKDRMRVLAALESTDYVTSFCEDTPFNLIKSLKPDILVKGKDWGANKIVGSDIVRSCGGRVITMPYLAGRSSSGIIRKIGKVY
ncbi:D-glycero-beta-D-manno-heptose 1-phosphate adenylyltransferase [Candidatus Omnitrophota bacterium]